MSVSDKERALRKCAKALPYSHPVIPQQPPPKSVLAERDFAFSGDDSIEIVLLGGPRRGRSALEKANGKTGQESKVRSSREERQIDA